MARTATKIPPSEAVLASRQRNAQSMAALRNRIIAAEKMEPAQWQEQHSGTEAVVVNISSGRQTELTRRRAIDARVWDSFTPEQEAAALDIRAAFEIIAGEVSIRTAMYEERVSRGDHATEENTRLVILQEHYWRWGRECKMQGVSHSAAMDVLFFHLPISEVDRTRKMKAPWARNNLVSALNLYCTIRGWQAGGPNR